MVGPSALPAFPQGSRLTRSHAPPQRWGWGPRRPCGAGWAAPLPLADNCLSWERGCCGPGRCWGSSPATHDRGCCTMMGSRGQPSLSPRVPMEWNVCRASVPRHKELLRRRRGGAGSLQMPRGRGPEGTAFVQQAHDFLSASGGVCVAAVAPAPRAHCLAPPESGLRVPAVQPAPMQPARHRLWFQEVLRDISSTTVDPAPGSAANSLP